MLGALSGNPMIRLAKFTFGSVIAGAIAIGGLGGLNLYTYHRFTEETVIATLQFDNVDEQRYRVTLRTADAPEQRFELRGDEWQLDVRMIKWTDWLTFLGESPLYQLDRISGRYVSAAEARSRFPLIHDLSEKSGLDVWGFARKAGEWLPGIDAAYGSSVYLPMEDKLSYEVSISRTGLVARPIADGG